MVTHHSETGEIPCQCVTPGDYVLHEGRTYIASTSNTKKRKLYVRNLIAKTLIIDRMTKVLLSRGGPPVKAESW